MRVNAVLASQKCMAVGVVIQICVIEEGCAHRMLYAPGMVFLRDATPNPDVALTLMDALVKGFDRRAEEVNNYGGTDPND